MATTQSWVHEHTGWCPCVSTGCLPGQIQSRVYCGGVNGVVTVNMTGVAAGLMCWLEVCCCDGTGSPADCWGSGHGGG